MKTRLKILLFITSVIIVSCSAPKVLVNYKANAEQAETAGNFDVAVLTWKNYFNQQQESKTEVGGADYASAAKAAFRAEEYGQATSWFDEAKNKDYADAEMYKMLAHIYKGLNNLTKELDALEYYVNNFDSGDISVNKRLFEIYYETDMDQKALAAWKRIPYDSIRSETLMDDFFRLNKKLENDAVVDSVSQVLLEMDPNHVQALEWNAQKYYWEAENLYQAAMKKYNQNKTGLEYIRLKQKLDTVTANFKKALGYFERLWKINPDKKYAGYLANIHTRFDEPKESAYYRKFLDEK